MKTKIFWMNYLLLTCFVLFLSSCGKEKQPEPDLVPITMTGANTMGFYVDGVPYNKKGVSSWGNPFGVTGIFLNDNVIYLHGGGGDPKLSITIKRQIIVTKPIQTYLLDGSDYTTNSVELIDNAPLGGNRYMTDGVNVGELKITLFNTEIVSGTFHFDAINPATGQIIHVTDGRFDIKFQ